MYASPEEENSMDLDLDLDSSASPFQSDSIIDLLRQIPLFTPPPSPSRLSIMDSTYHQYQLIPRLPSPELQISPLWSSFRQDINNYPCPPDVLFQGSIYNLSHLQYLELSGNVIVELSILSRSVYIGRKVIDLKLTDRDRTAIGYTDTRFKHEETKESLDMKKFYKHKGKMGRPFEKHRSSETLRSSSTQFKKILSLIPSETLKRRRGTTEKSIGLEDLNLLISASLKDAVNSPGVSRSTLPSHKIQKVNNHSISKQKHLSESVEDSEAALNPITSLATSQSFHSDGPNISRPFCISDLDGPNGQQLFWGSNYSAYEAPMEKQSPSQMILQDMETEDGSSLEKRFGVKGESEDQLPKGVWDNDVVDGDGGNSVIHDSFPIHVGETFASAEVFRDTLITVLIKLKREVDFEKSEKKRIVAKCSSQGCKWRIYAGGEKDNENIVVKTMLNTHTCHQRLNGSKNKLATSIWVSNWIMDRIRQNPEFQPKDIQTFIKSTYQVDIDYMTAYRAKGRASKEIHPPWVE